MRKKIITAKCFKEKYEFPRETNKQIYRWKLSDERSLKWVRLREESYKSRKTKIHCSFCKINNYKKLNIFIKIHRQSNMNECFNKKKEINWKRSNNFLIL